LPILTQTWRILPILTQNLANLADINSKLGESCRYELKNLANLADMNSNLANLADMDSRVANLPV
jgi:hypothetical protein